MRTENERTTERTTRFDLIQAVCKDNKIRLNPEAVTGAELGFLLETMESSSQGNVSDWYYLTRLAKECGCWAVLVNSELQLLPINAAHGSVVSHTFRMFDFPTNGVIGPKNKTYPILGFSSPTSAVYLSGASQGAHSAGVSSETREVVTKKVDDASSNVMRTNPTGVGVKDASKGSQFLAVDAAAKESAPLTDTEFKAAVANMGVHIEVETLGVPTLLPGNLIEIKGVSKRFDAKYVVFELEHLLGSGGFTTKFTAISNTAQLTATMAGMVAPKQSNPKPAPPTTESDTQGPFKITVQPQVLV
jgi:phage protein D